MTFSILSKGTRKITHLPFSVFKIERDGIASPSTSEGNSPMCTFSSILGFLRKGAKESIKDSESGRLCGPNGLLAAEWRKFARFSGENEKSGVGEGGEGGEGDKERKNKCRIAMPISKRFLCSSDAVVGGPSHDYGRRRSLSRFPREWDNRNTGFCG